MSQTQSTPVYPAPPSLPSQQPPRKGWQKVLIGCGIGCGALIALVIAGLFAIGIGIESGAFPDTAAQPRGKIPAKIPASLKDWGVIEADEEILYFYSAGLFSIADDGNLFTDRRVISYEKLDDGINVVSARYEEIENIELEISENWFDDSVITIHEDDGEWFILWVSSESGLDEDFYEKLEQTWQAKRGD